MNKENEILSKILNIETIMNDIYKEIINLRRENEIKSHEQFQIMTRIENIADFVKSRYNVILEENEKFMIETIENKKVL